MTHSHSGCKAREDFEAVTSAFSKSDHSLRFHKDDFNVSKSAKKYRFNLHDFSENAGLMCKRKGPKSSRSHFRTRTPRDQVGVPVDMRIAGYRVQHQRRDSASHTSLGVRFAALMTCQVSDLLPQEHFKNNTDEKPTV